MKGPICLLLLLAGCSSPAPLAPSAPAVPELARAPDEIHFTGECSLTAATVDEWIGEAASWRSYPSLLDELERHACEHGWAVSPCGVDFADDRTRLRCPQEALARMIAPRKWSGDVLAIEVRKHFAIAWERMGRLDVALESIGTARQSLDEIEGEYERMFARGLQSDLCWLGYELCIRHRALEAAFEFATDYKPSSGCGNCLDYDRARATARRARLLVELGRAREAIDLFRGLESEWTSADLAAWIDADLASGEAETVEEATRQLAKYCRRAGNIEYLLEEARALRELRVADRATRLARLHDFSVVDEDGALELALSLDDEELLARASAFDVVDNDLRDPMIAMTLARTGAGVLEPHVLRASAALGEKFDSLLEDWRTANARRAPVEARRRQAVGR